MINYQDFENMVIRAGEIIKVEDFPKARKPAYILTIDFGAEIGIKNLQFKSQNITRRGSDGSW